MDSTERVIDCRLNGLAKQHFTQKTPLQPYFIFPNEKVVAVRGQSGNGNHKWLEVAEVFSDEEWEYIFAHAGWGENTVSLLYEARKTLASIKAEIELEREKTD